MTYTIHDNTQGIPMNRERVILDTDPAIGVKFRDLDDGLAILFLLASPEVHLEGLTINFGNVDTDRGLTAARTVLQVAGADTPVYSGSRSKTDLGTMNPAVEFMIETVRANPKQITLLAVAPLTNVATAMMLDDTFAENLRGLIVMGGTFSFPFFSFFGEFNFHNDGVAASRVIRAPIPKTLITMDVCSQAVFQDRHLDRIREKKSRVAEFLSGVIPHWLSLNKKVFFRKKGFFPWDPVAAAYLIERTLFDDNRYTLDVSRTGPRAGRLVNARKLSADDAAGSAVVTVPLHLDGERFMELLLERLLSL